MPKCLSTLLTNMRFPLQDNKALIVIISATLRVLQKKCGNIAIECSMKESIRLLMLKKGKTLMQSILDSVKTEKEY